MSPFYCLACAVEDNMVPAEERDQWVSWLEEWAEWIMHDLPSWYSRVGFCCGEPIFDPLLAITFQERRRMAFNTVSRSVNIFSRGRPHLYVG